MEAAELRCVCGADAEASQAQLQLLLAELKRIEGQQQQLKTAAAENKVLIVHPVKGFDLDEEDEYAEEEEAQPNPDRFIPSGQQELHMMLTHYTLSALLLLLLLLLFLQRNMVTQVRSF